jgi:hypothetical protein
VPLADTVLASGPRVTVAVRHTGTSVWVSWPQYNQAAAPPAASSSKKASGHRRDRRRRRVIFVSFIRFPASLV